MNGVLAVAMTPTQPDPAMLPALYHWLSDPGDFDGGAIARLGEMLWRGYPPEDWARTRDQLLFPRLVAVIEAVEQVSHADAVRRAARIAIHATFRAQDLLDVQAEIDELHARLRSTPAMRPSLDELLLKELVA